MHVELVETRATCFRLTAPVAGRCLSDETGLPQSGAPGTRLRKLLLVRIPVTINVPDSYLGLLPGPVPTFCPLPPQIALEALLLLLLTYNRYLLPFPFRRLFLLL